MRSVGNLISLTLALSLTAGCVPMQKYRDLETSLAGAEDQIGQKDQRIDELESELAKREAVLEDLKHRGGLMEQELTSKRARLDEALSKEAALMADKGKLSADVEAMTEALRELEIRKAAAEARVQEFRQLLTRFQALIDAGKLKVKIVDGRMVVELATDVLFASGSAELSKPGREALIEVSALLAGIRDRSFQVEGHTDNDPIKTAQYPSNWELAAARAITVVRTMIDAGMPPVRISAASYAEFRPVASNDSKETKSANRRIEIVVMPDLSKLPGYQELQDAGAGTRPPGPPPRKQ